MNLKQGAAGLRRLAGRYRYIFGPFHANHNLLRNSLRRTSARDVQIANVAEREGRPRVRVHSQTVKARLLRVGAV